MYDTGYFVSIKDGEFLNKLSVLLGSQEELWPTELDLERLIRKSIERFW